MYAAFIKGSTYGNVNVLLDTFLNIFRQNNRIRFIGIIIRDLSWIQKGRVYFFVPNSYISQTKQIIYGYMIEIS